MRPFIAEDLENLDPYECLVKTTIRRKVIHGFDLQTLPLATVRDQAAGQDVLHQIIAQTRQRFSKPSDQTRPPDPLDYEDEDIEEE